jgi:hypothetical protein
MSRRRVLVYRGCGPVSAMMFLTRKDQ